MAGYGRYRRSGSRYSRRTYTRNRRWRTYRGQQRSANQQRDSGTFVINASTVANVTSAATTMINIYDILRKSEFFQNYAGMYDQFKINRIRVKLTQGNATNDAFTLVSAWDRNGLEASQLNLSSTTVPFNITSGADFNTNLRTYSSAVTKSVSSGSSFSMIRYLAPSTMAEKSQWIAPNQLQQWYTPWDTSADDQYQTYAVANATLQASAVTSNPSYLLTDTNLQFKPTFLMNLWSSSPSSAIYNVEFDITVTFRGMRKSGVV